MAELISEYQDDQQPAGGLAQVTSDRSVNSAPAPAAAPASPQPSEYEKAMANYQKQKQQILANHQRLVDSLEARVAGPQEMLWGLARAFSAPTRTGSFGESFGHATEALGQHFAQQKQQMSDIAKMKLELQMQELGLRKEDVEFAKAQDMRKALSQMINASQQTGVAGQPGAASPSGSGSALIPPSVAPILNVMAQMNPESAIKYIADLAKDDAKRPDAVKAMEAYISMLPPEMQNSARAYAAKTNIFGKPEDKVTAEKAFREMVASEQISPAEGEARIRALYGDTSQKPSAQQTPISTQSIVSGAQANLPSANLQGNPKDIFAQIEQHPDPAIREEMKQAYIRQLSERQPDQAPVEAKPFQPKTATQVAVEKAKGEAQAKAEVEEAAKVKTENQKILSDIPVEIEKADKNIVLAKRLEDYVTKNPNAIGIMRQKFVGQTIANFLNEGFHLGQWRARLPIEEVIEKNLPKQDQLVIQGVRSILMEMALDQAAKLKGSVSNYEDQMVQAVRGNEKNSPEFLAYTARKIRLQSEYDKMIKSMYYNAHKENPNLLYRDFVMTDDARKLQKQFEFAVESAAKKTLGSMQK